MKKTIIILITFLFFLSCEKEETIEFVSESGKCKITWQFQGFETNEIARFNLNSPGVQMTYSKAEQLPDELDPNQYVFSVMNKTERPNGGSAFQEIGRTTFEIKNEKNKTILLKKK